MDKKRQEEYDNVYMNMASEFAKLSQAKRAKVGCLLVSEDGQILSQGYNGMPRGMDNCCENGECTCKWVHGCQYKALPINELDINFCIHADKGNPCDKLKLTTKPELMHAETNAILKCARDGGRTKNAKMYVTLSPCLDCAKVILQAGISKVYYKEEYRDRSGLDLLNKCGIITKKI